VQGWLAGQELLLGRARSRSKPERQEELESGEGGFSLGFGKRSLFLLLLAENYNLAATDRTAEA
jgi:hypothetical protein